MTYMTFDVIMLGSLQHMKDEMKMTNPFSTFNLTFSAIE